MICHKNLPSLFHNPTLAMSGLLQILYIIPTNILDSRLWTLTSLVWQPIKHLIPTCPVFIQFLPASVKLWCRSITDVWHLNHDTTNCPLLRIFIINVILSSTNAFSNPPINGSPSPISSKSSR